MAGNALNSLARVLFRNVLRTHVLSYHDLRLLGVDGVFDSIGFMGEAIALGWIVLQLTGSPFMVGAALGARMAPSFFLGIPAGTIADMVDRRVFMRALNVLLAAMAAGVSLLLFTDSLEVWHLFVLAPVAGVMSTLYMTLRHSYVYDIVGPNHIVNGLAFVGLGTRAGGAIGSLAMGFIMARIGWDVAYLALAVSYLVSAAVLLLIHSRGQAAATSTEPVWESLKHFGVEARRNSTLLTLVIMTATVEVLGFSNQALLPSIARDVLDVGAVGLGVMGAVRSLGGVVAALFVTVLGDRLPKGLTYPIILLVFGAAVLLLGLASNFALVIVAIATISGMAALSDVYSQSMMQLVVPNKLRGRSMGAWVLATGTAPLGNLQIGALASAFTIGFALGVHGVGLVVLALAGLLLLPKIRRL